MSRSEPSVFQFPEKLGTSYQDFIMISSYNYVPYQSTKTATTTVTKKPSSESTTSKDTKEEDANAELTLPKVSYSRSETGNAAARFIKDRKNVYYLPMPDNLVFSDGMSWEAQNVGALGLYGGEFIKSIVGGDGQDFAASVQALSEAGLSEFALKTINRVTSGNFITQQSASKVINPYREQVFNGMNPRAFSFSYKFVPETESEQTMLGRLLRRLREDSLPTTAKSNEIFDALDEDDLENVNESLSEFDSSLADRWFGVPRVFEIKFLTYKKSVNSDILKLESSNKLPKIKPCICKAISINYTPDNVWATRTDGAPIATEVSFEFEEMEIVVAQDVRSGF